MHVWKKETQRQSNRDWDNDWDKVLDKLNHLDYVPSYYGFQEKISDNQEPVKGREDSCFIIFTQVIEILKPVVNYLLQLQIQWT